MFSQCEPEFTGFYSNRVFFVLCPQQHVLKHSKRNVTEDEEKQTQHKYVNSMKVIFDNGIDVNKYVDYRGSLSTVYNDGEISTCWEIIEVHSVQSTVMGRSQHVGRL